MSGRGETIIRIGISCVRWAATMVERVGQVAISLGRREIRSWQAWINVGWSPWAQR
jgi:hypothetical protein